MPWTFATVELNVANDPPPARSGGYRMIRFRPPGYNGISATIPDGRTEVNVSVTLQATSYADYEVLVALCESGEVGDLEIPHNSDHWVYANAFIEEKPTWEFVASERLYRARVTFVCPDPVPTWKTSGLDVF